MEKPHAERSECHCRFIHLGGVRVNVGKERSHVSQNSHSGTKKTHKTETDLDAHESGKEVGSFHTRWEV